MFYNCCLFMLFFNLTGCAEHKEKINKNTLGV